MRSVTSAAGYTRMLVTLVCVCTALASSSSGVGAKVPRAASWPLDQLLVRVTDLQAGYRVISAGYKRETLQYPGFSPGSSTRCYAVKYRRDLTNGSFSEVEVWGDLCHWRDDMSALADYKARVRTSLTDVWAQTLQLNTVGNESLLYVEGEGGPGEAWIDFRRGWYTGTLAVTPDMNPGGPGKVLPLARLVDQRIRQYGLKP